MAVILIDFMGSPNIGVYSLATENYVLVPIGLQRSKIKKLEDCLKVTSIQTDICGSKLIGIMVVANSNGIIVPKYTEDDEIKRISSIAKVNIEKIDSKMTALRNLILANDYGAVVSPLLMRNRSELATIRDILGVETDIGEIAGSPYVGSLGVTTNKGALVNPHIKDEEKRKLAEILKVPIYTGTINGGVPIISSGLMANTSGAAVGFITSGSELFTISNALEV